MTKYYVVAGNRQQFEDFIRRKSVEMLENGDTSISFSSFVYVDSEQNLAGIENPHGWFYGTWRERTDIRILLETLNQRSRIFNHTLNEIIKSLR